MTVLFRKHRWQHTHNATLRGVITPLSAERHGKTVALYERDAFEPSWIIKGGKLRRLAATSPFDHGIAVEVRGAPAIPRFEQA